MIVRRLVRRIFGGDGRPLTARVLTELARCASAVTFVQIGSNDADHGDPIRGFVLEHGWTGLMIEPVPYVYERLLEKWQAVPGLSFLNCAIDEVPGSRTFYFLERSDDPLPLWYDQLGSFHLDNILKHREYIPDIDRRVRSISVECRTVADVVPADVTVFHCDVEGHDDRLVHALLDSGRRPEVIVFEHVHVPADTLEALLMRLRGAGYVTAPDGQNTVAVRRSNSRLARLF